MSKEKAKEFFYEVAKNKELAESVSQLMKESLGKEAAAERLISLAKNHGFNFTKEEAAIAQKDFKMPLSDNDLEEISGGFFGAVVAAFTFVVSAFVGASSPAGVGQPDPSAQYQMEQDQRDVDNEDLDEFSPAMFDALYEDNDDINEENDSDESSSLLFETSRNDKMYEERVLEFGFKSDFNSGFDQKDPENDSNLLRKQLKEERMNKRRYEKPPTVALSPGGGGDGGDNEYKNKFKKAKDAFRALEEERRNFESVDVHEASEVFEFNKEFLDALAKLKVDVSKFDLRDNYETSSEQIEKQ